MSIAGINQLTSFLWVYLSHRVLSIINGSIHTPMSQHKVTYFVFFAYFPGLIVKVLRIFAKLSCPNYCHLSVGPDFISDAVAQGDSFVLNTIGRKMTSFPWLRSRVFHRI